MYEDIFEQIHREAVKRNLKESTVAAYCRSVDYFLRTVNKDISALTTDDVDAFLTEKRLGGLAPQTYNHYHASIRFFYKRILKMNWDDEDIPRMKLDRSLPFFHYTSHSISKKSIFFIVFTSRRTTGHFNQKLLYTPLSSSSDTLQELL